MSRTGAGERLRSYHWGAAAWAAAGTLAGVLLFVVVVRNVLGWDFEEASRSPLAPQHAFGPRYGGWFGSFGVMGWTLAAAISGLGAEVMRRRGQRQEAVFLLASTVLSAGLLFDDLFMIHSTIGPQYLGVPKNVMLLLIVAVGVTWGAAFHRRLLADPDLPILVWSVGWYALALWIDAFGETIGWGGVREESAKLIGVAAWLIFFARTTLRLIDQRGPDDAGRF